MLRESPLIPPSLFPYKFSLQIQNPLDCLQPSLSLMASSTPVLQQHNNLLFTFSSKYTKSLFFFNSYNSSLNYVTKPLASTSSSLFSSPFQPSRPLVRLTRVSTAPVEYVPPAPDFDFHKEIARLKALKSKLDNCTNLKDRIRVIDSDSRVNSFFYSHKNSFSRVFETLHLDKHEMFLLKCVVAAGQQHVFGDVCTEFDATRSSLKSAFYALAEMIDNWDVNDGIRCRGVNVEALRSMLKIIAEVERFYDCIGGIIGYQIMVLELLAQSTFERPCLSHNSNNSLKHDITEIHPPSVLDLSQDLEYASQAAIWGIEGLPNMGEIYPLGGSADRLGLVDSNSGECLPAAMLPYCGRTLLEGLIRDLQAREYLYFKLYGKQCITPVAIMTSAAKSNHEHVTSLCEGLRWFGRGRSKFKLFEQPLVPAVSAEDGQWLASRPFKPVCKPGGHGVIWKLAYNEGVFQWFHDHGRRGATVRQVSNIVAATDVTLLALAGIGLRQGKKLGFASCKRNAGATEGINVLIEKKNLEGKWTCGISCIEYTEFDKFGMTDNPLSSYSLQDEFPANTNILYVDLPSAELVASSNDETSLPGMVLNVKKEITFVDQFGSKHSVRGGRLECTMQNLADNFFNTCSSRCYDGVEDELDTFIVYNERKKVTSSTKTKRRQGDKSLHQKLDEIRSTTMPHWNQNCSLQTPDGSLLDVMRNAYDILYHCEIKLPKIEGNEKYVDSGPPFLILLHPALGPLWEVTRQKFHRGSISKGSELQIEVAEFLWRDVQLDGSLIILAENVLGSTRIDDNGETILEYGKRCGRCKLENVKILNDGIDWNARENLYWKHDVQRFEAVKVILHGNAEFEAVDVILQGSHVFEVPDGYKMKITTGDSGFQKI
ncbi:UTP--glucose-1-phosphate uridylyltransferase 3, chloroplastic isoform X3 [Solanum dulcamara]|uniref:UTP--glucose-1-phosphate uridylyltransferase 3, chloroplastic isoform X3 n=1 Tax=Solanum dulcamara TaxID=45834 RepID=UPI0024856A4A|nr:UTP--glucose-1-phosphate uridylyltransferase 3, chloroplastic isoform X3 [Solanum dulcamara]